MTAIRFVCGHAVEVPWPLGAQPYSLTLCPECDAARPKPGFAEREMMQLGRHRKFGRGRGSNR